MFKICHPEICASGPPGDTRTTEIVAGLPERASVLL